MGRLTMTYEDLFQAVRLDLAYIVDLMAEHDFSVTEREAFDAWLWACDDGNDVIVWYSPFEFDDEVIVGDIKSFYSPVECSYFPERSFDMNEWIDDELDDYVPKVNAKLEGAYYDAD
jgi:hypothetical protein